MTGHDAAIAETARRTDEKHQLSEDTIAELNEKLNLIAETIGTKQTVTITYFVPDLKKSGGSYVTCTGVVRKMCIRDRCNDAYSAIQVAVALAEAFQCNVNELPLSMVLSWYEQKAVCILLTLLHLGIKNIYLGPTLPAFISPNVLNYLVENYNIAPISTPEEDLKKILG